MRRLSILAFILGISNLASAQIDPSAAILLRSGAKPPGKEQLDSGRYTVKPSDVRETESQRAVRTREPLATSKPHSLTKSESESAASSTPAHQPANPSTPSIPKLDMAEAQGSVAAPESQRRGVTANVQELVLGGTPEEMDQYRGQLSIEDTRANLMEIDIAPTYIYNESRSNYWFHDYRSASPGVLVAAKVWLSPFFAVQTTFHNSLQADILGAPATVNYISVDHQWFTSGIRMRKFFGSERRPSSMSLGIDYAEYQMHVPPESTQRIRTKTSGPALSIEAIMPRDSTYAWTLGAFIVPKATFKESSTAVTVKSGARNETTIVGASFGGLYTFDRANQVFWKAEFNVERTLFSGDANLADPATGVTPKGVSITNSTTVFQLGYRWGN